MERPPVTPLKLAVVASRRPQKEIAAEVGVHPSRFSHIVNGLQVDNELKAKIAQAVGRPVDELWPASTGAPA